MIKLKDILKEEELKKWPEIRKGDYLKDVYKMGQFDVVTSTEKYKNQYQVWILDPLNHKQPVDGGVFDVTQSDKTMIIPINPKLPISKAVGFAITLEQPGGVVVSNQPLLLTAPKERPQITI